MAFIRLIITHKYELSLLNVKNIQQGQFIFMRYD